MQKGDKENADVTYRSWANKTDSTISHHCHFKMHCQLATTKRPVTSNRIKSLMIHNTFLLLLLLWPKKLNMITLYHTTIKYPASIAARDSNGLITCIIIKILEHPN